MSPLQLYIFIKTVATVLYQYTSCNLHYEQVGKDVRCIEDELPFEIPDSWKWCRLLTLVSILGDGIHGTPQYTVNGEVAFINGNNLLNGKIIIKENTKKVSIEEAQKYKKNLCNNTVLVSINGTIGNIAFYENEKIILGKSACYFNLLNGIKKEYIKILLETDYFFKYTKIVATGSTIKNVPLSGMNNFLVPMPPLNEQKRIIECIHSLDSLIQQYQKTEEQLYELNSNIKEKLKKSILQYAIEGKLVPQDPSDEPASILLERIRAEKQKLIAEGKIKKDKNESIIYRRDNSYYEKLGKKEVCIDDKILFEIPNSWEWCRFDQLFKLTSGQDLSTDKFNSVCKGIPYITGASNLENGSVIINRWTTEPKSFAYSGDLLLTCKGTIGKIAFLTVEKAHIARQIMSIASPYKIDLHYIKLGLTSNLVTLL